MARLLSRPPMRLHHHAYVVKDQEKNRQFFEDILGIPLAATWCEQHFSPWVNRDVAFCHTFYSLGDGGALAFFSFADDEVYRKTQAEKPGEIGRGCVAKVAAASNASSIVVARATPACAHMPANTRSSEASEPVWLAAARWPPAVVPPFTTTTGLWAATCARRS